MGDFALEEGDFGGGEVEEAGGWGLGSADGADFRRCGWSATRRNVADVIRMSDDRGVIAICGRRIPRWGAPKFRE